MLDRRIETRMLCADLVDLHWKDQSGKKRRVVANLEDISMSGACIQLDHPLPLGTRVRMTHPNGELVGAIRYCVHREIGYFLGVEFDENCRWSLNDYRPQHLLDPRRLAQERSEAARKASSMVN